MELAALLRDSFADPPPNGSSSRFCAPAQQPPSPRCPAGRSVRREVRALRYVQLHVVEAFARVIMVLEPYNSVATHGSIPYHLVGSCKSTL
eukprot:6659262-Pyramimonas_sp.AAC.1